MLGHISVAETDYTTPTSFRGWFAVRVKRSLEISVASCLQSAGYETLLPLRRIPRKWSDRIKILEAPIFPGYIFCEFDPYQPLPVEMIPGVMGIVSFANKLAEVDRKEIEAIRSVLVTGIGVDSWPRLEPGCQVEIEDGPLRGLVGVVIKENSEYRLLLSISLLNRCLAVEIDREWVRSL